MRNTKRDHVNQLGIKEDQAKSATGGLLNYLKNQGGGSEAQTLIAKLPGAEDVMQSSGASSESSGILVAAECWRTNFGHGPKRRCVGCIAGQRA